MLSTSINWLGCVPRQKKSFHTFFIFGDADGDDWWWWRWWWCIMDDILPIILPSTWLHHLPMRQMGQNCVFGRMRILGTRAKIWRTSYFGFFNSTSSWSLFFARAGVGVRFFLERQILFIRIRWTLCNFALSLFSHFALCTISLCACCCNKDFVREQ